MTRKAVFIAILLVLSPLLVVHPVSAEQANVPTEIDNMSDLSEIDTLESHTLQQTEQETEEIVIEADTTVRDAKIEEIESHGATVILQYDNLVQAKIDPNDLTLYSSLPWVDEVREPRSPVPKVGGEGAEVIGAQNAHESGITGDNTSVAVIDMGFNVSNSRISDNVVEYKSFGTQNITGTAPRHGTSSAEVALDVAPDADLYLATVATDVGYANALNWSEQKDVDVITASIGFFGQPNDGSGFVSQVSDETVNATDAVFTTSTGNTAESHWEGSFVDDDGDDVLEFDGDDEANYLNTGSGKLTSDAEVPAGVRIQLHLSWDDWDTADSNYNIALVRSDGNGNITEIDAAERDRRGAEPYKRLTAVTPSKGFYGVTVEKTAGDSDEVEVFARTTPDRYSSLLHPVARGSILSPAAAEETLGVGAFNYPNDTVAPYSSRGPTNDERQGVTFVAPDCATTSAYDGGNYCGTSGASPHGAGVAALLRSVADINHTSVKSYIVDTADPMPSGRYTVGAGALNASAAVGALIDDTNNHNTSQLEVDYDIENTTVQTGENVTVTATVENRRDAPNSTEVIFYADREEFYNETVELGGNENTTVEATTSFDTAGTHNMTVNDLDSTDITVEEASEESPVEGVSYELWTVVVGDDTELGLGDLGRAIRGYQDNGQINGVDISLGDLGSLIQEYQLSD